MGFSNQEWADLAKACTTPARTCWSSTSPAAYDGGRLRLQSRQADDLVEKFTATVRKVTSSRW